MFSLGHKRFSREKVLGGVLMRMVSLWFIRDLSALPIRNFRRD